MFVHDSNHKGNVAEAAIAAAAVKLGIEVLRPQLEHGRYDLVFEIGSRFHRVQCKWAALRDGVVPIRLTSSRYTRRGTITTTYSADEIDAVAAYCEDLDRCYLVPVGLVAGMREICLRVSPAKNSQRASLHWAAEYEFAGAIAQLGERGHGMAEVVGSSPTGSIPTDSRDIEVGAHQFRNHFGFYMERAAAGEDILITRRGKPHARLGPPRRNR
jgi:prevent-host-death family protein